MRYAHPIAISHLVELFSRRGDTDCGRGDRADDGREAGQGGCRVGFGIWMTSFTHSFRTAFVGAKSTELAIMKNKDAGGSQQTANLCEDDDGQQEAKRDPSSTSNVIVRPMTCGEVCTSIWHILTSDEAVVQTEVGPDGKETKMGLLGRLNARRRKLTLMHPIMVGLVFSVAGLYDAGTDVLLAATFGSTVLIELDDLPNGPNGKCGQYFDPTWSEYVRTTPQPSYVPLPQPSSVTSFQPSPLPSPQPTETALPTVKCLVDTRLPYR
jgi:hypothetical protein